MNTLKHKEKVTLPPFVGSRDLLIIGDGVVNVLKSIDGENFHPVVDGDNQLQLQSIGGVVYNASIENQNGKVRYQLEAISGDFQWGMV